MECSLGISNFFEEISSLSPEKVMAPHSSTLAWKIPWMEEPHRLQSMGSVRVRHDWMTSLSLFTFTFHFHTLEKEMATRFSVLAWRIPGTLEPDGLPSLGSHRVGHDWSDLAVAASLSHSIVFFYFFTLFTEEGFLSSPCYSLEHCIQMGVSFLFSSAFHFSSFLSYL